MHLRKIQISPSMMCADFLHLEPELRLFDKSGADWLHIDVMDGHYVPNFTLGIDYCRAVAATTRLPFDVHLMVDQPDRHVESFASLPGARLTFHPETVRQPVRLIERIRALGASPGIAIGPGQSIQQFHDLFPLVDQILIMTVSPGYAGQELLPHCLEKIPELRTVVSREGLRAQIEVDGNVSWENIPKMVAGGADILVVGTSSVFEKNGSREQSWSRLRALLEKLEAQAAE